MPCADNSAGPGPRKPTTSPRQSPPNRRSRLPRRRCLPDRRSTSSRPTPHQNPNPRNAPRPNPPRRRPASLIARQLAASARHRPATARRRGSRHSRARLNRRPHPNSRAHPNSPTSSSGGSSRRAGSSNEASGRPLRPANPRPAHGHPSSTGRTPVSRRHRRPGPTRTGSIATIWFPPNGFRRRADGAWRSSASRSGWSISASPRTSSARRNWRHGSSRPCAATSRSA